MIRQFMVLIVSLFMAMSVSVTAVAANDLVTKNDVILVVGATGKTGRLIVSDLQTQGYTVRSMVRNEKRGREILGDDATLVKADLTEKQSLVAAVEGVSVVINAAGAGFKGEGKATPEWIDYKGTKNLVEISKDKNLKKFVLISSMGVTHPDHFLNGIANNVLQWKLKGENALRNSGINYSIIRPGGLTDKAGPEQVVMFYQGDNNKGGPIRREDVSRVVIAAMLSPQANKKTYEVMAVAGTRIADFSERFAALAADE